MDVETAAVIKLLDRLIALVSTWSERQDRACAFFDSVANIQSQREDTLTYLPRTAKDNRMHQWMNPVTTPTIVLDFPDLVPRLLGKQTRALERSLENIQVELREFERVAASLEALRRDALYQLTGADSIPKEPSFHPASISFVEAASWIDEVGLQYRRELTAKQDMLASLNLGSETANIQEIRDRWGLQSWINLQRETEIRDRLKLLKSMEGGPRSPL
ncbi:hypothetical protein DFJ77DRAFT_513047 [Powellomyces hirtus]|nr:hypothetical protein DFJ77DRAFT_513047 [Powellomyces hirtus]